MVAQFFDSGELFVRRLCVVKQNLLNFLSFIIYDKPTVYCNLMKLRQMVKAAENFLFYFCFILFHCVSVFYNVSFSIFDDRYFKHGSAV